VKNKKGPAARKREGPPREAETKRFLKPTKKELKTQEGKIFLKFAGSCPPADLTLNDVEAIWTFIVFLKKSGYHIIDGRIVFCFPFDRLVKLKDLK